MELNQKVLCPVDLSDQGPEAIELATQFAKQNNTTIVFIYVLPYWGSETAALAGDYIKTLCDEDKKAFHSLRPTDASVAYEHLLVHGNPGPTIVTASKTAGLVVVGIHGRGTVMRLLMGSVAQYVLRNAQCPVVLVKGKPSLEGGRAANQVTDTSVEAQKHFVTEVMQQVAPIHAFDEMDTVIAQFDKANETAAPVVRGFGECIGILTLTDIDRYRVLLERFAARDATVIEEMFEVDPFGQRRVSNSDFNQVKRHMTKDVVSIKTDKSIADAVELLEVHPHIHHLVVLDEENHAVGIVDAANIKEVAATLKHGAL